MFDNMKTEETSKPADTKMKIISLLQKANEYVWMSSGFNSGFYNDPDVKKAMDDSFKKVKQVKIIIDGDIDIKKKELGWLFDLAKLLNGKLQIRQCRTVLHWLIVDGKHFRLEKTHLFNEVGIKNLLVYDINPPVISEILRRKFDKWWSMAIPVDP